METIWIVLQASCETNDYFVRSIFASQHEDLANHVRNMWEDKYKSKDGILVIMEKARLIDKFEIFDEWLDQEGFTNA